jgi:hypothetical protein
LAGSALKPRAPGDSQSMYVDSEMNADDIQEELRDVVFDYEGSKALVLAADGFLTDETPQGVGFDTKSEHSTGKSTMTAMSQNSVIRQNKLDAGRHDPYRVKLLQDRLDAKGKARLEHMLNEIDDHMDELMKEKAEYAKQGMKTTQGGFGGAG